ncbi:hypothetical protein DPMN_064955 [Dreissena polymorpha]|uniref:Uncharacterized protein n=1 Tax=Dreissena polymorpha TaxID=45954 RepID=A0A9D4CD71_DREPO|nr:hypothetical protein DPMN_064955 [Dreissena polymorpha]
MCIILLQARVLNSPPIYVNFINTCTLTGKHSITNIIGMLMNGLPAELFMALSLKMHSKRETESSTINRGKSKLKKPNASNETPIKVPFQAQEEIKKLRLFRQQSGQTWANEQPSIMKLKLFYGAEKWRTTVTTMKKIQVIINTCLLMIIEIRLKEHVATEELWRTKQLKRTIFSNIGDG